MDTLKRNAIVMVYVLLPIGANIQKHLELVIFFN